MFFATSPIPLMLRQPKDSKNALLPAAGLRLIAKLMGLKCTVRGKENIVKDSGCVVVINHQSILDLIVLAELWPVMDRCTVISKREIFYLWPFGLAAWLWGTIFIDRLNARSAQKSINSTGAIIRDRKARVLMFPEGTRSMKDKLLPFKKGAFHLAIASQCPVQPVVVSRYTFLGDRRFDGGSIDITILSPLETKGLVREDVTKLMENTYSVMTDYLESISPSPNNNIAKSKFD
ncbi:Acyltransferase [Popillia japonica]|uniref:1-acyl-sn-glycerol-3-phosphate acyltransferase n=1 Tax=Popillia japonica TaxID=7064 RepID=A0AAW1MDQ1_POPJA